MCEDYDFEQHDVIDKKIKNKRVENTELVIEDDTIYEIDLECCHCRKKKEKSK